MANELSISINGKIFKGWESVSVSRSLESASGTFLVSVSDVNPRPIKPNDKATVSIAGKTVLTGYVDKVDVAFSGDSHTFTVSGRDKTADVIDCAAALDRHELTKQNIKQIAETIAKPFGITVKLDGDAGATFPKFSLQPGDTAYATIERAARQNGMLVITDGDGNLVLTKPQQTSSGASLVQGQNILEASLSVDVSERFSKYTVKGQSAGTDDLFGEAAAQVNGAATDENITRNRPMVVLAEQSTDVAMAKKRAKWEAVVRAARGTKMTVKVPGWTKTVGGDVWKVNELVGCDIPMFEVKGDYLISGVKFEQTLEGGTTTTLEVTGKDAYNVEPGGDKLKKGTGGDDLAKLFEAPDK